MFLLTYHLPKLLIKPLIHRIAAVVEYKVVVLAIGVAEMEFPEGLIKLRIITNYPVFMTEMLISFS